MSNYRKLVAAGVAFAVLLLAHFGIGDGQTLAGMPADTVTMVITSILGALGVWGFKNEQGS